MFKAKLSKLIRACPRCGMSLVTPVSSPEPNMASWQVDDLTAGATNQNATRARSTRPEDKSSNPPEALLSTSFKG